MRTRHHGRRRGRPPAAERIDERPLVGIGRRAGQRGYQRARPVGVDHVEIRIEVLEHVPRQRHRREAGGAVIGRKLRFLRQRRQRRVRQGSGAASRPAARPRSAARTCRSAARCAWSAARASRSAARSAIRASFSARRPARSSGVLRRSTPRSEAFAVPRGRSTERASSSAEANGAAPAEPPVSGPFPNFGRTVWAVAFTGAFIGRPPPWSSRRARSSGSRSTAGCRRNGSPCRGRRCRPPAPARSSRTAG